MKWTSPIRRIWVEEIWEKIHKCWLHKVVMNHCRSWLRTRLSSKTTLSVPEDNRWRPGQFPRKRLSSPLSPPHIPFPLENQSMGCIGRWCILSFSSTSLNVNSCFVVSNKSEDIHQETSRMLYFSLPSKGCELEEFLWFSWAEVRDAKWKVGTEGINL